MGLTASLAAWVVAVAAAVAVGGHVLGDVRVPPTAYAVGLLPGLVVAVAAPIRRDLGLPPRWRNVAAAGLVFGALYAFAGDTGGPAEHVPALAGLAIPAVAVLWPRPAAVRGVLGLAVVSLLAPGAQVGERPTAVAAVLLGAAVALVAANRQAAAAGRPLGPAPAVPPSPRRLAAEAGAVAALLVVAALLSTLVDPPSRQSRPREGSSGDPPARGEPAPLAFDDSLDPRDGGRGGEGGGDEVLLRIRAPRADVWRAVAYDRWDGRRWRRSAAGSVRSSPPGARFVPVPNLPLGAGGSETSSQQVEVVAAWAEVAVGAPDVQYLELPGGAEVASDGVVRLVPPLGRGAGYTAHSMRAIAGGDELRTAGPGIHDPALLDARALGERAAGLAARITADAPTAYDKVRALERWMAANVAVDDDGGALPPATDPVDDVLFGARAGPPERLATTLAVLARSVGVPARVAAGFLPGERPLLGGRFVVRARHAHMWVEVPFAGLGWQRFDPTGRIDRAVGDDSFAERLKRLLARWWPLLAALALAAGAAVVRLLVLRRRRRRALPWATRCLTRLSLLGSERGRPRRPSETPAEYAAALAEGVLGDERIRTVGRVVTEAAWSGHEPDGEARRWADAVVEEVASSAPRRRRTR